MRMRTIWAKDFTPCFIPSHDNSKLGGILGISYLPMDGLDYLKSGLLLTDVKGTCKNCDECARKCYARSSNKRFEKVTIKNVCNTLQLRNDIDKHFADIENYIVTHNIEIVRYTESGEIETSAQFEKLVNLARKLSNVYFYLYTKNYEVLRAFFNRSVLPNNMTVLVSVWGKIGVNEWKEFKKYRNVKCFAVNSDLQPRVFCPAYKKDKNGRTRLNSAMTCEKCGLCYRSKVSVIGCLEH